MVEKNSTKMFWLNVFGSTYPYLEQGRLLINVLHTNCVLVCKIEMNLLMCGSRNMLIGRGKNGIMFVGRGKSQIKFIGHGKSGIIDNACEEEHFVSC